MQRTALPLGLWGSQGADPCPSRCRGLGRSKASRPPTLHCRAQCTGTGRPCRPPRPKSHAQTRWHVELPAVVLGQQYGVVLAVGGTPLPHIHSDVQHTPTRHPHQFPLRVRRRLKVKSPKRARHGTALVRLHELHVPSDHVVEGLLIPCFTKRASVVFKTPRPDQNKAVDGR